MKQLSRLAALAAVCGSLACVAPVASAATDLGTLGTTYTVFGNDYSKPVASFTDYYSFKIASSGLVAGGTLELDFGNLYNLNVSSITLSGGTLAGNLIDLNPTDGFNFTGLGVGTYEMAVSGNVTGIFGGAYLGAVHAVPTTVAAPVPEPEDYLLTMAGLVGVAGLVRRGRKA